MSQSLLHKPDHEPRPFTGGEAAPFELATAADWTAAERRRHPDEVHAYFFGRRIIERMLAQPGCMGLRVYYATDPKTGVRHLLIVGADANRDDQLPHLRKPMKLADGPQATEMPAVAEKMFEAIIAEMAIPCPDQCGSSNALNSRRAG